MLFKLTRKLGLFGMIIFIIRAKTFRTRKNFPGSNATLLPGFLGLWETESSFVVNINSPLTACLR